MRGGACEFLFGMRSRCLLPEEMIFCLKDQSLWLDEPANLRKKQKNGSFPRLTSKFDVVLRHTYFLSAHFGRRLTSAEVSFLCILFKHFGVRIKSTAPCSTTEIFSDRIIIIFPLTICHSCPQGVLPQHLQFLLRDIQNL